MQKSSAAVLDLASRVKRVEDSAAAVEAKNRAKLQARREELEQALSTRRCSEFRFTAMGLVQHSDAGRQYTSIVFTDARREAGITGSIGSFGDALDSVLMESTVGLYKSELIDQHPTFAGRAELERETASWVH